jgi:glucose uptake protein GlcU
LSDFAVCSSISFRSLQRIRFYSAINILGLAIGMVVCAVIIRSQNIVALFSKDIVKLVIIAGLVASPFSYAAATCWLDSYAFRINVTALLLLGPVAWALSLAFLQSLSRS